MLHRFWFCLWSLAGVFADSDSMKSVMEGDSVFLQTHIELQTDNVITWVFRHPETLIAQIIKRTGVFSTFDVLDGRFRDRLMLDHQTGSLTITNARNTDSGLYEVDIIRGTTRETTHRFNVSVYGVFPDSVKSVSVMEGESVSLQTHAELKTNEQITWTFGLSRTEIAEISEKIKMFSTYDVLDGRFRDRLKLDHQTGSLTITNTRNTDSGLYEVTVGSRKSTYRFNLTVSDSSVIGCDSAEAVIRLVVSALMGVAAVAAVVVLVYDIRSRRAELGPCCDRSCLCMFCSGVFADSVKSVSVMEGESVSLQTHTELQARDLVTWTFGHPETLIALIDKEDARFTTYDGRFRDRLKLDYQTGSLTITNTRNTDSGLYEVSVGSRKSTYRFNLTVSGVFPDSVKSVSVMEGESVSLQTHTELKKNEQITWTFGQPEICVAQINKDNGRLSTYDVLGGRFRDRLKLDYQTGSLTITNTRNTDSGLYQVTVGSRKSTYRFNLTVSDSSVIGCDSAEAVIRLVVSALMGVAAVAAVVVLVYDIRSRRAELHVSPQEK
ncbi:uncharacterized protein LOC122328121 [Puntigrus tetrazona]|uniref:uncharacterized protein LOC122328121 n=1 Tax=Puntigrus tetrazona TaxID=1606681 RepID=UPI001C89245B|nr:uncharacterized protein LOC122328121 [Puntigrus tetrazona]